MANKIRSNSTINLIPKLLFVLIICVFSSQSKGQDKAEPNLEQTISWIKSKLMLYTYDDIIREVKFDNNSKTLIIIDHNFDVAYAKITYTLQIPLSKLNPSGITVDRGTSQWTVFHLVLTTNGDKDIKGRGCCPPDGEKVFSLNKVSIFLNRNALSDNMDIRLKEAFINAIKLSGGKGVEEYF